MTPYFAALGSALLMWAAFPPVGWGLLGFVAPAPLVWAIRRSERLSTALNIGFIFGLLFFGAMLNWVFTLGAVAWIPLTFWLAMTSAALTFSIWLFRHWSATRFFLISIGLWALWELVRTLIPFGGFPWGLLGYAAASPPGFIGSVQWVGPGGWSVLAVAVAVGLVLILEDMSNWRLIVDAVVVVLLLALAGGLFPPRPDGDTIRVAIIQGNSPCPGTRCDNENKRIFEMHLALTQQVPAAEVDLVVWAENSMGAPYEPVGNPEVELALAAEAERMGAYLLVSGTRRVGLAPDEFLNVNRMYSPTGDFVGEYTKRHPVPFGEFVPLRDLFDFIPQLNRVPRDMKRGDGPVVFVTPKGSVGSVISFEGAFSRLVRSEAQEGSGLIVVATNESSYGKRSNVPSDQLIALVRINAAAVGQDIVHAAITGKSTIIRADGTLGERTEILESVILRDRVTFRVSGQTLFTRLGEWLLFAALLLAAMAIVCPGRNRAIRVDG